MMLLAYICAIIIVVWGVGGMIYMDKVYSYNPMHVLQPKELFKGGPLVWIICLSIGIYNFLMV
ncbi:hypothetical protein JZU46_06330, partial [bacterium]|nr:hypothetical protein [bacterium]